MRLSCLKQQARLCLSYLELKTNEEGRGEISHIHFRKAKAFLLKAKEAVGDLTLAEATKSSMAEYLDSYDVAAKTWNHNHGYLNAFFNYCVSKDWMKSNPVSRIEKRKIRRRRSDNQTLSAIYAQKLMSFVEVYSGEKKNKKQGFLVTYFALCLFAGIRPDFKAGEICRASPKT